MKGTTRETACRTIHVAGLILAGETGSRAANKITETLGLGRVEWCDQSDCEACAPRKD